MSIRETSPEIRRWSDQHSVLCLGSGLFSVLLRSPVPFVLTAFASLCVFFWRHRPSRAFVGLGSWANGVTWLRLAAVCVTGLFFWESLPWVAGVFALTLVLDGVDGWLARRRKEASEFGAHFDMETDAFMVALLCGVLALSPGVGAWVLLPGALRYLLVVARRFTPSGPAREVRSQWTRGAFVLLATSLIFACLPLHPAAAHAFLALGVGAVSVTFTQDFWRLGQQILERHATR
jgi:phosphatidylglycerophosphate synthase